MFSYKIDVQAEHFLLLVCSEVLYALLTLPFYVLRFANVIGGEVFAIAMALLATLSFPGIALIASRLSEVLKVKKDENLCLSLGVLFFVCSFVLWLVSNAALLAIEQRPIAQLFGLQLISAALWNGLGAFILFLWLLAIVKYQPWKTRFAAFNAAIFTVASFVVGTVIAAFAAPGFMPALDWASFVMLLSGFVVGFAVLYHASMKKLAAPAYLFGLLYVVPPLVDSLVSVQAGVPIMSAEKMGLQSAIDLILLLFLMEK